MSHITPPVFAVLVWGGLMAVTAVFLYLVYAIRSAGGIRIQRSPPEDR